MTDPDATSRADPVMGEMCHWIVTGISIPKPTSDQPIIVDPAYIGVGDMKLSSPDIGNNNITELMPYLPPSPPPKTGLHRYVFVFLASVASEDFTVVAGLKKPKERPHWGYGEIGKGVKDWAMENGLVAVGEYMLDSLVSSISVWEIESVIQDRGHMIITIRQR